MLGPQGYKLLYVDNRGVYNHISCLDESFKPLTDYEYNPIFFDHVDGFLKSVKEYHIIDGLIMPISLPKLAEPYYEVEASRIIEGRSNKDEEL